MRYMMLALTLLIFAQQGLARPKGHTNPPGERKFPAESGAQGLREGRCSPHVFSEWHPSESASIGKHSHFEKELRQLVEAGRRDRAASPDFLDALEQLLVRHAGKEAVLPSDRLPMTADFGGADWPAGWEAVNATVWQFGDGVAEQTRSWADARFVLFYAPGQEWRNYTATFRCESSAWMVPPARSAAVLYFRYRGVDDTYTFWVDGAGDIALISSEKGKSGRLIVRVPVSPEIIRDGKPWTVRVKGDEIEVWHEGVRWLQATDSAHPSGTVGLESVHIPMKFSGVSVK